MTTDALDEHWLDTPTIWRERPPALDQEPDLDRFRFASHLGEWVVFGHREGGRLPDWLAVHRVTGEVRWLPARRWGALLAEIVHGREPPSEEQLARRWARAQPIEPPYVLGSLATVIRAAWLPVYGLIGRPRGLTLASDGARFSDGRVVAVTLTFTSPTPVRPAMVLRLTSVSLLIALRRARSMDDQPTMIKAVNRLAREYGHPLQDAGADSVWQSSAAHLDLEGATFDGVLLAHPKRDDAHGFALRSDEGDLAGVALGLPRADLLGLLTRLQVLNDRPAVVEDYVSEMEENRRQREAARQSRAATDGT